MKQTTVKLVWNDDAPVEAATNACADDDVDEDETDSRVEREVDLIYKWTCKHARNMTSPSKIDSNDSRIHQIEVRSFPPLNTANSNSGTATKQATECSGAAQPSRRTSFLSNTSTEEDFAKRQPSTENVHKQWTCRASMVRISSEVDKINNGANPLHGYLTKRQEKVEVSLDHAKALQDVFDLITGEFRHTTAFGSLEQRRRQGA